MGCKLQQKTIYVIDYTKNCCFFMYYIKKTTLFIKIILCYLNKKRCTRCSKELLHFDIILSKKFPCFRTRFFQIIVFPFPFWFCGFFQHRTVISLHKNGWKTGKKENWSLTISPITKKSSWPYLKPIDWWKRSIP